MSKLLSSEGLPETLYHYCTTSTFHSIISNNSIRLSSMSLSNDAMEGKMVHRAFSELAKSYSTPRELDGVIPLFLSEINDRYDGLAICLSEAGDLLSQWSGYADDGQGFCIGFSSRYLVDIEQPQDWAEYFDTPVQLRRVLYDLNEHLEEVRETYLKMQSYVDRLARKNGTLSLAKDLQDQFDRDNITQALFAKATSLINSLFILKSDAFSEEREWRLISTVESETHQTGEFRPTACNLIPFQTIKLGQRTSPAITEVIIGPKNKTPTTVLKSFLRKHGHAHAVVHQSSASYR
jgi:hypothetical protein